MRTGRRDRRGSGHPAGADGDREGTGRAGGPGRRRPGELPHGGGVVVVRGAVAEHGPGGGRRRVGGRPGRRAGQLAHGHRVVVVRGAVAQARLGAGRGGGQGGDRRGAPGEVLAVGPGAPRPQAAEGRPDPGHQAGQRQHRCRRATGPGSRRRHQAGDGERLRRRSGPHRGRVAGDGGPGPGDALGRRQAGQRDGALPGVDVRRTQPSSAAGPDDRVLQRLGHGVSSPHWKREPQPGKGLRSGRRVARGTHGIGRSRHDLEGA